MDVSCEHCQAKFKIPDEKVPKNQAFAITCPKCKKKFSVDPRAEGGETGGAEKKPDLADEVASGSYDAADRPFDFIEEGAKTALICESDPSIQKSVRGALEKMDYHVAIPKNAREVLKQMRFHVFDLLVVNETFDTPDPDQNNVLRYTENLGMEVRRRMFVALITDRFRTNDNMSAFNKSVNIVINRKNIGEIQKILERALVEFSTFYKVYKEAMAKAGRSL